MRGIVFGLAILAVGCGAETERPPDFPGGGGGGGSSGGQADAGSGSDAATAVVSGTLCQVEDVRFPELCTAADLTGASVTVFDGGVVTTGADGTFSLPAPDADSAVISVAGLLAYQPTTITVALDANGSATDLVVPFVTQTAWDDLQAAIGTNEPAGTSTVAIYIKDGVAPAVGAEVISLTAAFPTFYDGNSPTDWNSDGLTGSAGAALLFAVPDANTTNFEVIAPDGASIQVTGVDVIEGQTTFVRVGL